MSDISEEMEDSSHRISGIPPKKRRILAEFETNDECNEFQKDSGENSAHGEDTFCGTEAFRALHTNVEQTSNNENGGTIKSSYRKKAEETKMKRNSGITYTSLKNGKTVSERQNKELSLCRLQCREKISDQRRLLLFKEYWDLGKYSSRNNEFKFRIFVNDSTVYVCKKCFIDVYGESESFVRSVQEKMVQKKDLYDHRGKTSTSGNQIPQAKKDDIIAHIKSFPAYEL